MDADAELGAFAIELATGAAELVQRASAHQQRVSAKSTATDLVTETDRAAEQWLVQHIAQARPHDAVLGEEGGGRSGSSGVRWVLDPIDGTVNFVLGIPQYAISVAAERNGVAVAAAVVNPVSGETFHAVRGDGAYLGEQQLSGPRDVPLGRAVIGTGFGYDSDRRARQVAVIAGLLPRIADIRRMGAASLDLCAVAAGRLDGYFEVGLSPWDYAAGVLIAREAGCLAIGVGGAEPSSQLTIVAGPALLPPLAALLTELGVERVF